MAIVSHHPIIVHFKSVFGSRLTVYISLAILNFKRIPLIVTYYATIKDKVFLGKFNLVASLRYVQRTKPIDIPWKFIVMWENMKASNVKVMTESCSLLTQRMIETGNVYPQHLGVTEAGAGTDARIKSCLGIAYLLNKGIGDTIRVSLTEPPVNEITFAKKFMAEFGEKKAYSENIATPDFSGSVNFTPKSDNPETAISETCISLANSLIDRKINNLQINGDINGYANNDFAADLMQAAGICISKAEFISCPGCGRTNYDLERISEAVKREFSHLKGLKIATMGCVVNGPGEMADADYGCVGSTKDHVIIYKGQIPCMMPLCMASCRRQAFRHIHPLVVLLLRM